MSDSSSTSTWIATIQTLVTTIFVSIAVFLMQRRFQMKDEYTKEKNKLIATQAVQCETELFNILKEVFSQFNLNVNQFLNYANQINTLRLKHYLYIDENINKTSQEFADYCLEVTTDINNRTKFKEETFIKNFKKYFKK
jgi:hypothetical protein